ncbi:hypothetical protein K1719_020748 [Acacia pycnantha]|nr:hypothetical protein K1719_020748 [Acacia pycnantha]
MDQTREVSIHRRKRSSFGLKDSSFEEAKKVELQERVKLRCESDHDHDRHSFTISKRKRDAQREEESVGNELEDCGFSLGLSSNTWLFASDHNQQRSNGVMGVVVPKKARSSNNSVRKKTSKSSSSPTEEHNETDIALVLYGLNSSSRNQDSSEKIQTNAVYENNKVDLMASKSSTAELVKIEREKLDDDTNGRDCKAYVPNKDTLEPIIDLMAPPSTDLKLGNNIDIEDKETKMDTFNKNQDVIKIDMEAPNKDDHILANQQVNKTVSPAWSRNLPPLGYVPPSLQPILETDKTTGSSSTVLQLVDFVLSPPQPKHCASHHYIARNIFLHQQLLRANSISSCGTKPNNVNEVPTPEESKNIGKQSQNGFPGVKKNVTQVKKELVVSNKSPDASNSVDSMQMDQQRPYIMHQPSPPIVGNSICPSSSNNSSPVLIGASPAAQNSSLSIGLSSSHRQSYGVQDKANKLTSETCEGKSPYIVGQKNMYSQNFTVPIQPKNENFGDKKQEANSKGGFELVSSQSFAISFHSQPSVAWQKYYSAWTTTQGDEKKVNSGKSSSSDNGPTTFVFDESSKYLSFVLSPKIRACHDHSMASSSQNLLQLQMQQQQPHSMVTQDKASNSTTSATELVRKSSRRPLDSLNIVTQEQRRVLQGYKLDYVAYQVKSKKLKCRTLSLEINLVTSCFVFIGLKSIDHLDNNHQALQSHQPLRYRYFLASERVVEDTKCYSLENILNPKL